MQDLRELYLRLEMYNYFNVLFLLQVERYVLVSISAIQSKESTITAMIISDAFMFNDRFNDVKVMRLVEPVFFWYFNHSSSVSILSNSSLRFAH